MPVQVVFPPTVEHVPPYSVPGEPLLPLVVGGGPLPVQVVFPCAVEQAPPNCEPGEPPAVFGGL